jgi:outer membrane protein OmpA-like peptidoglycan-associated protein
MSESKEDLAHTKALGHEPSDADAVALTYIGLVLLLVILVCVGTVFGMNWLFSGLYPQLRQPMTQVGVEPGPAPPGIGPLFSTGLGELRAHKRAPLTGYGWVDRSKGIAHIPIEQAMALVAQRGLIGTGPAGTGEQGEGRQAGPAAQAPAGAQSSVPGAGEKTQQPAAQGQPQSFSGPAEANPLSPPPAAPEPRTAGSEQGTAAGPAPAKELPRPPVPPRPQHATPQQGAAAAPPQAKPTSSPAATPNPQKATSEPGPAAPSPVSSRAPAHKPHGASPAPAVAVAPERFTIQQSLFERGALTLQGRSRRALDRIAARLRAAQQKGPIQIQVRSYTDSSGSAAYNLQLSARRAAAVRRYLISQGVNGDYVGVQGMGEANPIASNATAAGRARNRRIEIEVQPVTPGSPEAPPPPGAPGRVQ